MQSDSHQSVVVVGACTEEAQHGHKDNCHHLKIIVNIIIIIRKKKNKEHTRNQRL